MAALSGPEPNRPTTIRREELSGSEPIKEESRTGGLSSRLRLAGRSGWQLLVSYGIASWIVLQVAETLGSLIGLPLWFGRSLLVLLIVGLLLLGLSMSIQAAGRAGQHARTLGGRRGIRGWLTVRNVALASLISVGLFVLGTAAHLGLRVAGIGPSGTLMAKGVLIDQDRLILADFESRGDDAGLGPAVTTLFRIDLAQSPSFTVLEPAQLVPVLARMQRDAAELLTAEVAIEAARREGIKAIVAGEVLPLGDAFVVAARLVSASAGEVLAAVRETAGSAADLPNAVDRASARLRERIGESLRTIRGDEPLERVTTRSFSALEKYARADLAYNAGEEDVPIDLLEEAIADDSTFAMAYRKLAIILLNQGREEERARRAFTRAWELRDHLSERERWLAEAAYRNYVEENETGAVSVYRTLLEKYPSEPVALNNLAIAWARMGRHADALELYLRSIDAGNAPAVTYGNAVETLVAVGQPAAADSMLALFREAFPGNAQADLAASSLASAQFDYGAAERFIRRYTEAQTTNPTLRVRGRAGLATIMLIRGHLAEARRILHDAAELEQRTGASFLGLTPDLEDARVNASAALWYFDDAATAVSIVDTAFTLARVEAWPPDDRPYADLTAFYVEADRIDRAREWLNRFRTDIPADDRENDVDWHQALAVIARAERRYDEAIREFSTARELTRGCSICFLPEIGRTHESAGQPDSAISVYTRYVEEPFFGRVSLDAEYLWRVLLRLAELHEQAGRPREAIRYYSWFLDLWADADPRLQFHVLAARRSMTRLMAAVG